ncbi:serine/threonine protein kinase [Streptomyces sp. J2-1]|uniref:serine/threonine-protein kinase n=1 Tax=Streptomyces corallincola TaxID=2851888 RepID=UPI001C3871C5|nr:serine/threonine-protein kinase [Streptomyces corallincola]MBV2353892.1 serine/threonine protein kinase [Streptomyces corallincola]
MQNKESVQVPPDQQRTIAGRYRLLAPLGEGGMGTVWRAEDETLHREVAVKEVRAPSGMAAADIEKMYTRLEREAWAAARIPNRNVVTVYDVATDDGRPWIVMELVRGRSLGDLLRDDGPMDPCRAAEIGAEVLSALRAAHGAGVLHRDVKPANVLLSDDGRVILTDFGIATVEGDSSLTMTGEVVGSPEYLPPERALGRVPGPESDLWSLGVLLYASVEGVSPFRHDTPLSTLRAIVDEELPPPCRSGALTSVIEGLLVKEPAERMTAEQAERDLRTVAGGGTPGPAPAAGPATVPSGAVTRTSPAQAVRPAQSAAPTPLPPPPAAYSPGAGFGPPPAAGTPGRGRRTGVLVAAAVVGALLVGGLSYELASHKSGTRNEATGSGASPSTGTREAPGAGATPNQGQQQGSDPQGSGQDSGQQQAGSEQQQENAPASQAVRVTVTGANTTYVGACAPPADQAPTFTATFAVDQAPAKITYRWVSKDGSVVDHQWRQLSFPSGGDRTGQDVVSLTTWSKGGTLSTEIGVEVKGAGGITTSNTVPFSITCEGSSGGGSGSGSDTSGSGADSGSGSAGSGSGSGDQG